jgi:hypothetical protein
MWVNVCSSLFSPMILMNVDLMCLLMTVCGTWEPSLLRKSSDGWMHWKHIRWSESYSLWQWCLYVGTGVIDVWWWFVSFLHVADWIGLW